MTTINCSPFGRSLIFTILTPVIMLFAIKNAAAFNTAYPENDVRYWGAVPDGVTDSTSAIQSAVNYAVTNGVQMYAYHGTNVSGKYEISGTINIPTGYYDFVDETNRWGLVGDGVIEMTGNNLPIIAFNGDNISDFELGRGLTLRYKTPQSSANTSANIIAFLGSIGSGQFFNYFDGYIHGMTLENGYNAIYQAPTGVAAWEIKFSDLNFFWNSGSSVNYADTGAIGIPNVIFERCYTRADSNTAPVYAFSSIGGLTLQTLEINNSTNVIGLLVTNCANAQVHQFHLESAEFDTPGSALVVIQQMLGNPQFSGFVFSSITFDPSSGTNAFIMDTSTFTDPGWNDDMSQIYIQDCTGNGRTYVAISTNVPMTVGVEAILSSTGIVGNFPSDEPIVLAQSSLVPLQYSFINVQTPGDSDAAQTLITNDSSGIDPEITQWRWTGSGSTFMASQIQLTEDGSGNSYLNFLSSQSENKGSENWSTNFAIAPYGVIIPTNRFLSPPAAVAYGGIFWNSNNALYWITPTHTNLISEP